MTSVPGFGARREAREDALAVLYEAEMAGGSCEQALGRRGVPLSDYAIEIALGIDADRARVDEVLSRHLHRWRLERLAVVDRAVARLAAWELIHRSDVPTAVVLSEAVELATLYGGAESPRFLNGVLSAVADEVRGQEAEPAGQD